MGIIAWIILGLVAGLLANMLIPGKRSQGLILTCLIGVAGALGGGWVASRLFHVHTLHGFFNLSTWLTAIAGAAVLLLIFHLPAGAAAGPARPRTADTPRRRGPGRSPAAGSRPPVDGNDEVREFPGPGVPVHHVPAQRALLDVQVVEVLGGIGGHPDPPHHGLRAQVLFHGDGDDSGSPMAPKPYSAAASAASVA